MNTLWADIEREKLRGCFEVDCLLLLADEGKNCVGFLVQTSNSSFYMPLTVRGGQLLSSLQACPDFCLSVGLFPALMIIGTVQFLHLAENIGHVKNYNDWIPFGIVLK